MNNFGLKFHHLGMATDNLKLSMNLLKKQVIKLIKYVLIKIITLKTLFAHQKISHQLKLFQK